MEKRTSSLMKALRIPAVILSYCRLCLGWAVSGKMADQETHFEAPEINKTESKSLSMNSNSLSTEKKT